MCRLQTVFGLSIVSNNAEQGLAAKIIKHKYMLMCNHKIVITLKHNTTRFIKQYRALFTMFCLVFIHRMNDVQCVNGKLRKLHINVIRLK